MKTLKMALASALLLTTVAVFAQDKKSVKTYEAIPERTVYGEKSVAQKNIVAKEPDTYPSFKGGNEAFFKYIGENINYPKYEKTKKIEGKVFASFVVKADGSIGKVSILKSVEGSKNLDAEVVRVLKAMPKWNPAMKNDKAVNAIMNIPVSFKL